MAIATRFRLTDEDMLDLFDEQLPSLLERRPELETRIYHAFMKTFATKVEVATVLTELRSFHGEFQGFKGEFRNFKTDTGQHFEQVDRQLDRVENRLDGVENRLGGVESRLDGVESRMEAGFKDVQRAIDRLGARWGVRNESIFRQTMAELLEKSFGVKVETRWIGGEQFDCIIFDGEHILVEISASVGPDIQRKLERKRELYTQATGVTPTRVILVVGAIHSKRAQLLREAGFTVIEPEEDALVGDV